MQRFEELNRVISGMGGDNTSTRNCLLEDQASAPAPVVIATAVAAFS